MNLPVQYTPGSGLNSFADKADQFLRGEDTPSNFLDRCITSINTQEPEVKAWVTTRLDAVQAEAKTADRRYASGTPLSPVDGMPIGIKDVIQTRDMPTRHRQRNRSAR